MYKKTPTQHTQMICSSSLCTSQSCVLMTERLAMSSKTFEYVLKLTPRSRRLSHCWMFWEAGLSEEIWMSLKGDGTASMSFPLDESV